MEAEDDKLHCGCNNAHHATCVFRGRPDCCPADLICAGLEIERAWQETLRRRYRTDEAGECTFAELMVSNDADVMAQIEAMEVGEKRVFGMCDTVERLS